MYRRVAWNNHGKHSIVWRCVNRVEHDPDCCDAPTVKEEELQNAVVTAINMALGGKEDMLAVLEENIAMILALEDETSMESIDAKLEEMQQFLVGQTEQIEEYDESLVRRMVEKITVYEDKFTVEFKSGTSVNVDR
ncbi:MAG: hypothetical protein RR869_06385 [Lachnospiraceae bacterium]